MLRLLDPDIMTDVLRGFPPAVDWLGSLTGDAPALPGFVVIELMMGCRTRACLTNQAANQIIMLAICTRAR